MGNEGDPVIRELLEKIAAGENLSRAEAERVMEQILSGDTGYAIRSPRSCWHCAMKGETIDEVVGFATAMRRQATHHFSRRAHKF